MSVWDKIEEKLQVSSWRVSIRLTPRETLVVREALNNWADGVIAEAPAWQVAQLMTEVWPWSKKTQEPSKLPSQMTGGGEKAVKSLDPKEVEVVRSLVPNAKARQGDTGQVMALPPKEWERIRKEIETKPDYYDKMMGNQVSSGGLAKKIGDQLQLVMGPQGKSKMVDPGQRQDPDLSGLSSDPTAVQHGPEQFGNMPPPAKTEQPPTLGTTYKQSEPENPLDDFDIDFDEPQEPETFAPASSAKPKRSRKRAPAPAAAGAAPETSASRRARVAKQDMEMMGAGGPEDVKRMTRSGKTRVK